MMIVTFFGIVVAINLGRLSRQKAEALNADGCRTIERDAY